MAQQRQTPSAGPRILITGAAGNLGSLLARDLAKKDVALRLMVHKKPLPSDLLHAPNAAVVHADLADKSSLTAAVSEVDVIVHFAGVLFAPRPEKFLPETNTGWFANLLNAALEANVKKVVLISFPHVEGPTFPDNPAAGRLDGHPISVHAQTRLEEERLLFTLSAQKITVPVVLRLGMVYGSGILMVDAARWLARRRLLAVWPEPTWIHLISKADCLAATSAAALSPGAKGIYHVGDEQPVTLQHFLDRACSVWKLPPPHRMPFGVIYTAASLCELFASAFRTRAPLTRDFVTIGRVPYCGDTKRMRQDLLASLKYPCLESGLETLC